MADKNEEFVRTIHAFSGIAGKRLDFIMRKIGFDAFNQVLRRSPVNSGRCRASWRYSLNVIDSSVEPKPKTKKSKKGKKGKSKKPTSSVKKGAPPTGDQLTKVLAVNKTVTRKSVIRISNSLPYSVRLEKGHSKQAPNGIVGPAFLSIRLGIIKAVRAANKAIPDA